MDNIIIVSVFLVNYVFFILIGISRDLRQNK